MNPHIYLIISILLIAGCAYPLSSNGARALTVTVSHNGGSIGVYDVYELTLTTDSRVYANPWEDPTITGVFLSPSNKVFSVGGFFFDTNTYKIRFAPRERGNYTWTLAFDGNGTFSSSGGFTAVASSNRGFLRRNPTYNRGFITEADNKGFHPIGYTDCLGRPYFWIDQQKVSTESWFETMKSGGNNFFRLGISNCSYDIHEYAGLNVDKSGKNRFDIGNSKYYDSLVKHVRQLDWKLMLTMTNAYGIELDLSDPNLRQATLNTHKYLIDRYGAYTDIWELMNETHSDRPGWYDYATTITEFVRSYDPYQHMVTTNFMSHTDRQPAFDINDQLHAYMACDGNRPCEGPASTSLELDDAWVNGQYGINFLKSVSDVPLIASEAGNHGSNGAPGTGVDPNRERYRIGIWTTFFNQMSPVWWLADHGPYFSSAGNMYIGPSERLHGSILNKYVSSYDLYNARPIGLVLSDPVNTRGYATGSHDDIGAYIIHSTSHTTSISGVKATLNIPPALNQKPGYWMNPATGEVVQSFTAASGTQTLTVPVFTTDIVLRISSGVH